MPFRCFLCIANVLRNFYEGKKFPLSPSHIIFQYNEIIFNFPNVKFDTINMS